MGGAVVLKIHLKQPKAWDGAILVAPMCKVFFLNTIMYGVLAILCFDLPLTRKSVQIADDMVPPKLLTNILIGLANVLPKHKLVPNKDLAEAAFRDLKKKEQVCIL